MPVETRAGLAWAGIGCEHDPGESTGATRAGTTRSGRSGHDGPEFKSRCAGGEHGGFPWRVWEGLHRTNPDGVLCEG